MVKNKEEEIKLLENVNEGLLDRNNKLEKQLTGKLPVQGSKHLLWDMIIVEAPEIRPYLNFIKDK